MQPDRSPEDIAREIVQLAREASDRAQVFVADEYFDRSHVTATAKVAEIIATALRSCREEWRPIETAPTDGTRILLGRFAGDPKDEHEGRIRVDWWRSHIKHGFTGFGQFNPQYWPATHWMPLPLPPPPKGVKG